MTPGGVGALAGRPLTVVVTGEVGANTEYNIVGVPPCRCIGGVGEVDVEAERGGDAGLEQVPPGLVGGVGE